MESIDSGPDHDTLVEENERLTEEVAVLRKFIGSMQHVMDAVEKAPPETEIVDLLEDILSNVMATIGAIDGSLLVLDEDTNELVFVISLGKLPQENLHWKRLPPRRRHRRLGGPASSRNHRQRYPYRQSILR